MSDVPPALSVRGIVKRFGGTLALDGATLDVRPGTLHALLGENGAGKTTLMRLAFGMIQPDSGRIILDGVVREWHSAADAIAAGIGMVHQQFMLVPAMTVAENIALGDRGAFSRFDPRAAAERVRRLSVETGLPIDPSVCVAGLPVGAQQRLEILKALAHDARLLILDEPTAVLSPAESLEFYAWLRGFVAQGQTAVLITHKVREALALADEVTVLRHGRTVLATHVHSVDEAAIVLALLGEPVTTGRPALEAATMANGNIVVTLDHVSVVDDNGILRLSDVMLEVRSGEILGVLGVEGAGQRELLRVLAGRLLPTQGIVALPPRIGFVPEDRLRDALISSMTLTENFALKEARDRSGCMPWGALAERTASCVRDHRVQTSGVAALAGDLSGGNQQRFVLARELEGEPELLVVENAARGLDIRASAEVFAALRAARDAGVAVVIYASDFEEVLALADRVVVCFAGTVSATKKDSDSAAGAMMGLS